MLLEGLIRQWGIPLALYSDRHAAFKYNARQKPVPVETTQFARVMRELGIQQIFALSPQAKGRVERMLETFQDRLVTELRLAGASTIDQAKEVLQEFLPKFNARFAVAAEQPETAYRPVPDELSLAETICIKDTRKVARDNTVKYHWRVLQLLPGAERPSYAGLRACLRSLQYVKLRLLPEGVIMSHSYSSDISREQFARILPCLESARRRTKPRTVDLYDVFCGVLYLLKSGCQWRMLPADFPDWRTCYKYFRQWSERPDPAKYSILEQVLKKIG